MPLNGFAFCIFKKHRENLKKNRNNYKGTWHTHMRHQVHQGKQVFRFFLAWATVPGCQSFRTAGRGKNFFTGLIYSKLFIGFLTKGRFSCTQFAESLIDTTKV